MNPEANKFDEKIKGIKNSFFSALDDFKKYYVYYNKNPEVDEYQNFFATSKSQLQGLNSDIFVVTNNIQKHIKDLNAEMAAISNKLKDEKDLSAELLLLINNIQTTEDGSAIMIDDAKEEYNLQYYKNWELFIGIIVFTGISIKMFNKPSNLT
jgi:galactitol-specific phosphotransferase system IIB component